jgi:phosphoribosyl-ATP pyrophosphohydrolase/phosphoribosyl-AMP cyclohydrolase
MNVNFEKGNGLIPVVIQDNTTLKILMLGYMNAEALEKTQEEGIVTFYSRSRQELWKKGSTSGNYLHVKEIATDCDQDTLLIKVSPEGPVCHNGTTSCFSNQRDAKGFLYALEATIDQRLLDNNSNSYITQLFSKGINKIAQKVGEEAVELVIEAKDDNPELFSNEAADLLFHFLMLLKAKSISLESVEQVLFDRSNARK